MAQPEYEGGILRVASADKTAEAIQETDREFAQERYDSTSSEVINLVSYLMNIWNQNRFHKEEESGIQEQMIANLEARNNEYSESKTQEIAEAGMPDIYMGLTNVKCSHAEDWLKDIFSASDRTWGIKPTPVPDPTSDVQETTMKIVMQELEEHFAEGGDPLDEAQFMQVLEKMKPIAEEVLELELKDRTQNMENKIHDQMTEGGWDSAFDDFLSDLVTLKAGIIKGPIARKHQRIEYVTDPDTGETTQEVSVVDRPEYWRVSPLDIYPAPSAEGINDGSLVEKIRFSRAELIALKDEPGYDAKAIDEILENFSRTNTKYESVDDERREEVEDKEHEFVQFIEDIEGLEFWCSVQGKSLIEYGVAKIPGFDGVVLQPLEEYAINAIVVGTTLIYVAPNDDLLGRRPYSKTGWRKVPGSFWYKGVPELMEDLQRIINAAVRAMCYNMSMASGPQVDVDTDRLIPGEDIESAYPGKVWQTTNRGNVSAPAVRFFNPPSNSSELFGIYENFARLADDYTGIPAYAYGSDRVAGAGRTSSGLSMLMTSAAKGIKSVILGIDKDIYKHSVRRQFDWNMQYDTDTEIKGDIDIVTTGAVAVMVKEQMSARRMEFLNATQNEVDLELLGKEGRANILREAASALEMENTKTVKSSDEIRELMKDQEAMEAEEGAREQQALEMEQQAAQAETQLRIEALQLENELKKSELQVEQRKIALEETKIQLEQAKVEIAGKKAQDDADTNRLNAESKAQKTAIEGSKIGLEALTAASAEEGALLNEEEDKVVAEEKAEGESLLPTKPAEEVAGA